MIITSFTQRRFASSSPDAFVAVNVARRSDEQDCSERLRSTESCCSRCRFASDAISVAVVGWIVVRGSAAGDWLTWRLSRIDRHRVQRATLDVDWMRGRHAEEIARCDRCTTNSRTLKPNSRFGVLDSGVCGLTAISRLTTTGDGGRSMSV